MFKRTLQIGILNIMHDKARTNADFQQVLTQTEQPVELHFYYPTMHYQDRPVPSTVQAELEPLDLEAVAKLDAFIITGAPIEQLPFEQITYLPELQALFEVLEHVPQRLYLCWGGMLALHELYQVGKADLPHKLFGVYPQDILAPSPLLEGLQTGFLAPHARYAESLRSQIEMHPQLSLKATTPQGKLFLVQNQQENEAMLFSHLEYQADGLTAEYRREVSAHPERHYQQPENQSGQPFAWQHTQQVFFENWIRQVSHTVNIEVLNYGKSNK